MRAVAYLRVSSASQVDGHSLDAQDRLFRELCKNRGWEVVRVYREEGRSAHVEAIAKRPVFRQLLTDVERRDFDLIVVHTLDRWSRNQRVSLEALAVLERYNGGLVSISENIDKGTPEGVLSIQMLGAVAQYYSDALGNHVKKGQSQRAHEGKHLGGIPFGYESCWIEERGERKRRCDPEHPGAVHLVDAEGEAIRDLFRRYAAGQTTLAELAVWLNSEGFRTRNTKRLLGPGGELVGGPRRFTTASVRTILHDPFYVGLVRHREELRPGAHEAIITQDIFHHIQRLMKRRSGRSRTFTPHPGRQYLLKGLIRCIHCGMPMWAQTYKNGARYYREHRESRSIAQCPAAGGSIPCAVVDEQVGEMISSITLPEDWLERALERVKLKDLVKQAQEQRKKLEERMRRMVKVYLEEVFDDGEYRRQKERIQFELASLVVPEANATEEAGKLLLDLLRLWAGATLEERRKLVLTVLDAVYVDAKGSRSVVEVRVKGAFRGVWETNGRGASSSRTTVSSPSVA